MWRKRDKDKMGLRTTHRQLEEFADKNKNSNPNIDDNISKIFVELTKLNTKINDLTNTKQNVIIQNNQPQPESIDKRKDSAPVFIPSVSTEGMSVNAEKIQKRQRKVNLLDSVDGLLDISDGTE